MIAPTIADTIKAGGYGYANELDLQIGIERVLRSAGYDVRPEVRLTPRDRIDFMVGRVGIEVKVKGSRSALLHQLIRYADHHDIGELLVVTTRARHHGIPSALNGKPVSLIQIGGIL